MRASFFSILTCSFAVTLAAANAQASGEADSLDYFVGDWQCGVQDADGVLDPNGFSTASTERLRGDWFATWILAFHDGTSDKMLVSMRYDAARKQYVLFLKDDNGAYGMGTADAWNNHALAFNGTKHKPDGTDVDFTQTFTILNDGKFSLEWQFKGLAAQPSLTCKK